MEYIRRLSKFEYVAPKTLAEACSLLAEHGEKAAVMAGGTDLLLQMKRREAVPQYLIVLKNIPGLDYIKHNDNEGLQLGPLVTMRKIQASPLIRERFPLLAQAADSLGSAQIRSLATLAGNICHAAPCADTIPPLMALGASLKLVSPRGERNLPIEEFFTAPFKTVRNKDELLAEITVPNQPYSSNGAYLRYSFRGAMDYPIVAIAVALDLEGNLCREARITGSFCGQCWRREGCQYRCPSPFRAIEAEKVLRGNKLEATLLEEAAKTASEETHPIVDREYTREMIRVFTRRAVSQASQGAK